MELCLGTVQLGMQYGIQNNMRPNEKEAMAILSQALALGIHWFDTASAYGESEAILGQFAVRFPQQARSMQIISKLSSEVLQKAPRREWKNAVVKSAEDSLKKLKKVQMDAFLLHNAAYIFDAEAVEALYYVHETGLTKSVGVSTYTPEEAMRALEYPQIGLIQVPYNVFDQRLNQCGFFTKAQEKNVHVCARSSLLQGLAVMAPSQLPPHMQFAVPYLEKFHLICRDFHISPLQTAIGYVVGTIGIDQIVFGVDSVTQLTEYVEMQKSPLPMELRNALTDAFSVVEEKLVNPSKWIQ